MRRCQPPAAPHPARTGMHSLSVMSHPQANRANAQLSTGPTTEQGRAVSCLNRLIHGVCGTFRVLKDESEDDFHQLVAGLREGYTPATVTEETPAVCRPLAMCKRGVNATERAFRRAPALWILSLIRKCKMRDCASTDSCIPYQPSSSPKSPRRSPR